MPPFASVLRVFSTRNVGKLDRLVRALPTPVVAYLIFNGAISGWVAWALGIAAAMLLITSVFGACSVYYLLGYSTCPISSKHLR